MSQSLAQLYTHLIFSTKGRQPFIRKDIRDGLQSYLGGILRELKSPSLSIVAVGDHVHILYRHSKNISLAKLLEELKANSSKWLKTKGEEYRDFHWQSGYGAFSVSASKIHVVKKYILNQEDQHREITFKDEFRRFLKEYGMDFEEKYIWD